MTVTRNPIIFFQIFSWTLKPLWAKLVEYNEDSRFRQCWKKNCSERQSKRTEKVIDKILEIWLKTNLWGGQPTQFVLKNGTNYLRKPNKLRLTTTGTQCEYNFKGISQIIIRCCLNSYISNLKVKVTTSMMLWILWISRQSCFFSKI